MRRRWICAVLPFFLCLCAKGQYISVHKFTVDDGLPNSNIFRIMQDKKGFLWFSTDNGLSRYDGNNFLNFFVHDGLSHNMIMSVAENGEGNKLMCTYGGGIDLLEERKGNKITNIFSSLPKTIYCLPDHDTLWIIDNSGHLYTLWQKKLTRCFLFKVPADMPSDRYPEVKRMAHVAGLGTVFATDSGLYLFQKGKGIKPYLADVLRGSTNTIFSNKQGDLLFSSKRKVMLVKNGVLKTFYIPLSIKFNAISALLIDHLNRIWITGPGLLAVIDENYEFIDLLARLKLENILINDIFEDNEGHIWLGTYGSGLYCIRSFNIINYPVQPGLINNYVKSVITVGHSVWFGSIGTLSRVENEKLTAIPSRHIPQLEFIYNMTLIGNKIYIGTTQGVVVKDINNPEKEDFILSNGALAICEDQEGRLWIGGYSNVTIWQKGKMQFACTSPLLKRRRVNSLASDKSGNIFIGTDSGTFVHSNGQVKRLELGGTKWTNIVNCIFPDRHGRIWIATEGGLCMWQNYKTTIYSTANILSNDKCTSVGEDQKGNIWVSTFGGLYRFNGTRFAKYDSESDLISNEALSLCVDYAGNIWTGTVNGISCIRQEEIVNENEPPLLYITSVAVDEKKIIFPDMVTLEPGTKRLRIDFSAIVYPRADKVEYEYKLQGLDPEWHSTTNSSIEFSSLPAGNYAFLLRARRNGGPWTTSIQKLQLTVLAPFWKKTWFFMMLFGMSTLLMYLLIRLRVNMLETKKREKLVIEDRMLTLKHQALNATINPHFVFNCLNSIQAYIQKNERDAAKTYLIQFSRLIRNILEHSKDIYISLAREIERLDLYLKMEQLRFGRKLNYTIKIDPGLNTEVLQIPNMIVQPYIENAILHGLMPKQDGGCLNLSISEQGGRLMIIIDDDGIGISAGLENSPLKYHDEHNSIGMQLIAERLRLLKEINHKAYAVDIKEKFDHSGHSLGTSVIIMLPMQEEGILI